MQLTRWFHNKLFKLQTQRGSSLIEVLIATLVVGLVVTAIATGMSYTVRNTSQARYRDVASSLAQDVQEVFRQERNRLGWNQFVTMLGTSSVYCFTITPSQFSEEVFAQIAGTCGEGQTVSVPGVNVPFYREALVTINGNVVEVAVTVEWQMDSLDQDVRSVQELRNY